MRTITTVRATAVLAALALTATACGDGTDTADAELELISAGTLTVCSDIPYEPFEFEDPDSPIGYSGFDIELVQAIAATADLDVAVVATGFEPLTSGTAMVTGQCDMAASAMTITPERAENIDFSDPYYEALQSLLAPVGSDITSIDDLTEGVVVGVQSGTTGEDYANENVPGAQVRSFEDPGDLFVALDAGQIDAILQDLPVNAERALQDDSVEVVDEFDTDENYGFAFEKDRDDDLIDVVNAGLQQIRDDGTYDALFEKYFPGA